MDDLNYILQLAGRPAKQPLNESATVLTEKSPPGFKGTVKAMKRHHKEIDNPWALSWYMKNKGYKSHYTKGGKKKHTECQDEPLTETKMLDLSSVVETLLSEKWDID